MVERFVYMDRTGVYDLPPEQANPHPKHQVIIIIFILGVVISNVKTGSSCVLSL